MVICKIWIKVWHIGVHNKECNMNKSMLRFIDEELYLRRPYKWENTSVQTASVAKLT